MNTVTRKQLTDQLNWRYATKQFDSARKISADDWTTLEEAPRLSPSSVGLQPWKMLDIDACPMEGFSRDEYDRILGLTEQGLGSAVVATLGYRSAEDKCGSSPKVRFDHDEVIQHF